VAATRQPGGVGVDVEQLMSDATANETADLLMNPQDATGATAPYKVILSEKTAEWRQR
jgi:4'-phosphopantetheinyl transferase EntD